MLEAASCGFDAQREPFGGQVRFGDEQYLQDAFAAGWLEERCGDCGVERGGYHHPGCDVEECPLCRTQLLSCDCLDDEADE